jgi:hypothetical protein
LFLLFICLILTEIQVPGQFLLKLHIMKFYEKLFGCSVIVICI